jgi:hypothetical protein
MTSIIYFPKTQGGATHIVPKKWIPGPALSSPKYKTYSSKPKHWNDKKQLFIFDQEQVHSTYFK